VCLTEDMVVTEDTEDMDAILVSIDADVQGISEGDITDEFPT